MKRIENWTFFYNRGQWGFQGWFLAGGKKSIGRRLVKSPSAFSDYMGQWVTKNKTTVFGRHTTLTPGPSPVNGRGETRKADDL